jgi:hypothetical protein
MTNREWIIDICESNSIYFNEKHMILYKYHNTESPLDYDNKFDIVNLDTSEIYLCHRLHKYHLLVYYYSKFEKTILQNELYFADGKSFRPVVITEKPVEDWNDKCIKVENIHLLKNKL